jgi:hypothetical protein
MENTPFTMDTTQHDRIDRSAMLIFLVECFASEDAFIPRPPRSGVSGVY